MKFKLVENFTEGWEPRDPTVLKGTLFISNIDDDDSLFISFDQPDEKVYKIKDVDNGYIIFKRISPNMNAGFIHQDFQKIINRYNPQNECSFTAYVNSIGEFVAELDNIENNNSFKYYTQTLKSTIDDFYIYPNND